MTALFHLEGKIRSSSLAPPHLIEVPALRQESERSCMLYVFILTLIFLLYFPTVYDSVVLFFSFYYEIGL